MTLSRDSSIILRGADLDQLPVATLVGVRQPPGEAVQDHQPADVHADEAVDQPSTDALLSEAYEAGFSEGVGAAQAAMQETVTAAIDGLDHAVDQLIAARSAWDAMGPEDALTLALQLAELILMREVASSAAPAREAILRCFTELEPGERAVIHLNPSDLEGLGDIDDLLVERSFEVVADPAIRSGDAVAETASGSVDGRIEAALDRVREELLP
jgi:flagellar biosynthesis/type III secretory pathway protein FliH